MLFLNSWRLICTRYLPSPLTVHCDAVLVRPHSLVDHKLGFVQVIKANDDLTAEHHQFFLYQMLRGLKYIHTGMSMA